VASATEETKRLRRRTPPTHRTRSQPRLCYAIQCSACLERTFHDAAARIVLFIQFVSIRRFLLVRALIVGSLTGSSSEHSSSSGLWLLDDEASMGRDAPAVSRLSVLRGGGWGFSPALLPPWTRKCLAFGGSGAGESSGVDFSLPLAL